jgi:tetratricopeptide (TPR) repeat protein
MLHARMLLGWRDANSIAEAAQLLRDLLTEAPGFMPARVLLAESLAIFVHWNHDPTGELRDEALENLTVVRRLAPRTAGLLSMMAHMHDLAWRFDKAARLHAAALAAEANDPTTLHNHAFHLDLVGRPLDSVRAYEAAATVSRHSVNLRVMLARQQFIAGAWRDAIETARRVMPEAERDPAFPSYLHSMIALVEGEMAEPQERVHVEAFPHYLFAKPHLSHFHARRGAREAAITLIDSAGRTDPGQAVAFVPTLLELGLVDEAMRRVEAAARARVSFLPALLRKPENAMLQRHPAYPRLRDKVFGSLGGHSGPNDRRLRQYTA